ncbi:unnamed protein product [Caenorhabditis angaria]|uniref:POU domain protein n=1 Tax=Caenorhabditis angaria TaxID=860376 RepID=A0A9P1N7R4_9PELO|nr:unnamed protein product [Caenorhabditis angaria]
MNGLEHALHLLAEANGSIAPERISPSQSGSSKRKSRPVKRIIHEEEDFDTGDLECAAMPLDSAEPLLASIQQQISSYASEGSHREEDEGASSEVLSTGSVDESMEQNTLAGNELLRRVAEVLSSGQLNGNGSIANSFLQQQIVASKDLSFDTSILTNNVMPTAQMSPLFTGTQQDMYPSPERILQAMLTPSLGFALGNNSLDFANAQTNGLLQTPLISPSSSLLQSLMTAQNATNPLPKKPENRPPVVSQTLKATKRRLFTDDERARAEAANLNNEERIDMSDLEAFAQTFKKQRIKFGFTQGDVGVALGKRYGTDFSQTTISRFEALNLSFKNMCKLRPLLKEWLADVEAAIEGGATITDLIERRSSSALQPPTVHDIHVFQATSEASNSPVPVIQNLLVNRDQHVKRRRKRTNLDLNQRASLDAYFNMNPRPDHDRMTEIANALELDRDVVRVWFCNRRQKMRRVDEPVEGEVATPSVSPIFANLTTLEQFQEVAKLAQAQHNIDDSDETSGSPDAQSVNLDIKLEPQFSQFT